MENYSSFQNNLEHKEAQKNWEEKGSLGVTAKDYELIGGTPDDILIQNPGKTLGELMSDEEIKEFILGTRKNISENEQEERLKDYNNDLKKNLEVTIKYLRNIGRLPKDLM